LKFFTWSCTWLTDFIHTWCQTWFYYSSMFCEKLWSRSVIHVKINLHFDCIQARWSLICQTGGTKVNEPKKGSNRGRMIENLPVNIFLSESSVHGKVCWWVQYDWFDHETNQCFWKCWTFFLTSLCNFSDDCLDDGFCLGRTPNHFSPNSLNKQNCFLIVVMGFNVGQCRKLKLIISAWMLNNWSRKMMCQRFSQKIRLLDFGRI